MRTNGFGNPEGKEIESLHDPILESGAVQAMKFAMLGGPNCRFDPGLAEATKRGGLRISELSRFLHYGPDTFIVPYAIMTGKEQLDSDDIARAYGLFHLPMVQAAQQIHHSPEAKDYFADLKERGFRLDDDNLNLYLFSCVGKIGEFKGDAATVQIPGRSIRLKGIVCAPGIDTEQKVALHFATAFANVSHDASSEIVQEQGGSLWLAQITKGLPAEIDYRNWCGSNLTEYTQKQIHSE